MSRQSQVAFSVAAVLAVASGRAAELPVPCVAGSCGPGFSFITSGAGTLTTSGNSLTINQQSASATFNWRSFNLSADGTVTFNQPDSASIALNRIFQADPSRIQGSLNANGHVYLINQNGILFAEGAKVNVGGLIASSLDITPEALENGIAQAFVSKGPAFEAFANGAPSGAVTVEKGAKISSPNGQVLLIAPAVINRGTIETPDGQTILAAGQRVFLIASNDADIRGLVVEVGDGGTVVNGEDANASRQAADLVGRISADRGNVTLAGLLVKQQGVLSATTTVRANGSIRLQARDATQPRLSTVRPEADRGGELIIGSNSQTAVTLSGTDTTVDANEQPHSTIEMSAKKITVESAAVVRATGGNISLEATNNPGQGADNYSPTPNDASITVKSGAVLDVSGASVSLGVERNVVRAELRGNQLADSPMQRDGALRSQAVFVDIRQTGTRADGTLWQGTPIGDLSGDISNIRRSVEERNLEGGTVNFQSQGSVVLDKGATVDVSGGRIDWQAGYVRTTRILGADHRLYDIANADADRQYLGIVDQQKFTDFRWGQSTTFTQAGLDPRGQFEQGYVEGRNAGAVNLIAPRAIINGTIDGSVIAGPLQRNVSSGAAAGASDQFRFVPRGAQLTVGFKVAPNEPNPNFLAGDVEIAPGFVELAADGSLPDSIRLRPELFGLGGVENLAVFSNRIFRVASEGAVNFSTGGSLSVSAARVEVGANITAAAGSVSLQSVPNAQFTTDIDGEAFGITIADGVKIDTAGRWINDEPLSGGAMGAPLAINGGTISLGSAAGSTRLGAGSVLDVSGGARRSASGAITYGRGGSISLAAASPKGTSEPVELSLGGELRGFGASTGGSLSLTANSICIAATDCTTTENGKREGQLWLTPETLTAGGFSSVSLATNLSDLQVLPGTNVILRQQNWALTEGAALAPTGASLRNLFTPTTLPDHQRGAVNLSLTAGSKETANRQPTDLVIGRDALIDADPGAKLSLRSDSRIFVDGILHTAGGSISVLLDNSAPDPAFHSNQGIWLDSHARLDTAGIVRLMPSPLSTKVGTVLNGGSVSLEAQRGYVFSTPETVIDVSGTSAELDVITGTAAPVSRLVSSNGGSISIAAAEGAQISAILRAAGGAGDNASGGTFNLRMDGTSREGFTTNGYLGGDRNILIANDSAPILVPPGANVPASLNGTARVAARSLEDAGFDSIALTARNLFENDPQTGSSTLLGYGTVSFEAGTSLAPRARLIVDAPVIRTTGSGTASLSSSYVALGSTDQKSQLGPVVTSGPGVFEVQANFLDLVGHLTLDGLKSASLSSSGDIRTRGVFATAQTGYVGKLEIGGDLTLNAQQIYPSTLTSYEIDASGDESKITVTRADGTARDVLSALGQLTLHAPTIENNGVLRAPFGAVHLVGDHIALGSGSVVSTSANGLTIPFGTLQGGLAWTYQLQDGTTHVFGPSNLPLGDQSIVLEAADIDMQAGATIDVSGGGDLLAYEFVRGPGGTRDVLSTAVRPNQFAIVPGLNADFAPYDPTESASSVLRPGDSVILGNGSGLAAGTYTLLPARYALLPGAYLVTAATGFTDLALGDSVSTRDGGVIVAGQRAIAGTTIHDSRTSGFLVHSGSFARQEARYDTARADAFFAASRANTDSTFGLPRDAGTVTLATTDSLTVNGKLIGATGKDGRGATLQIASDQLEIVAAGGTASEGFVSVSADQLNALGAQSLLLGGRKVSGDEATDIDVVAREVVVDGGVDLRGPEVLLVARDRLAVNEGASITAQGSAASADHSDLSLAEGTSLLRVSVASDVEITRGAPASAAGTLELAAGSRLSSSGSIDIDAGSSALLAGALDLNGGALTIGAPRIALGNPEEGFQGTVLDPAQLASLGAGSIFLRTRTSLDIYAGADLETGTLRLSTPLIRAGSPDVDVTMRVGNLALGSTVDAAPAGNAPGTGRLTLIADTLDFTGGTTAFSGFGATSIAVEHDVVAHEDGALVADGNLDLRAGQFSAENGVDFSVLAQGSLALAATGATSRVTTPGLGAQWSFTGTDITGSVKVLAPAGRVEFVATGAQGGVNQGGVTLSGGTNVDVSGRTIQFGDTAVAAGGGVVKVTSANGSIAIGDGAVIDVSSGGAQAEGGLLDLNARHGSIASSGTLVGASPRDYGGASIHMDADTLDFTGLRTALAANGFTGEWNIRTAGAMDLNLAAGESLRAASIDLTADGGSVNIDGSIVSSPVRGGHIGLHARDFVRVNGSLEAQAFADHVRGGDIELQSSLGGVILASGSQINVAGHGAQDAELAPGGTVSIRVPRAAALSVLNADTDALRLDGSIAGARSVVVEGFASYDVSSGSIDSSGTDVRVGNPWYDEAAAFAGQATAIAAAAGRAGGAPMTVQAGVELTSTGALSLDSAWDLASWRFANGAVGTLTLRAAGDVTINAPLSDGLSPLNRVFAANSPSWSYRIVAGADLASSNAMATVAPSDLGGGSITLASDTAIRTGTGSISLAAANDLVLANQGSVIYTAGNAGPGIAIPGSPDVGGLRRFEYPVGGGDIDVKVGRDVLGAPTTQFVTEWLLRAGSPDADDVTSTASTIFFDRFAQGIATLGGGQLSVSAGRDIVSLSASTPAIARQIGGVTAAENSVAFSGGGDLRIEAGRDVLGGRFYVDRGVGTLTAGDAIRDVSTSFGQPEYGPILGLGDGSWDANARRGASIAMIVNPNLLVPSSEISGAIDAYFGTYSDTSAASVKSVAGTVDFMTDVEFGSTFENLFPFTTKDTAHLLLAPPTVNVSALSGDIDVGGSFTLWPSPHGNLNLLAANDLHIGGGSTSTTTSIVMSDAELGRVLPTVDDPASVVLNDFLSRLVSAQSVDPRFNSPTPVHMGDAEPLRLYARDGDIEMGNAMVYSPKHARVLAGRDILNLGMRIENLDAGDISTIAAGRDITFPLTRDALGQIQRNSQLIAIGGAGALQIEAGRNVDLQASAGIQSEANLHNAALSDQGADISVLAGLQGREPGINAFTDKYLDSGTAYDARLLAYVKTMTGEPVASKADALARFRQLDTAQRLRFAQQVLFAELRDGGRSAAADGPTHNDFTRAFAALETLFPGANPDLDADEVNPYLGDIRLFFSRIYTLGGGNIDLLAPGGEVNVGLATPPVSFGLQKTASELGVVVQSQGNINSLSFRDFQVNESRAFAADGGNILVWSTRGDIDAGRGAKTAISAPPPTITIDQGTGQVTVQFPPALTGSGIQTLATSTDTKPGDVDLFAPRGVVNASDAGIVAGNLTIAATAVLGANNIQVSGTSVGVPVDTGGLGLSLAGASSVAGGASNAAVTTVAQDQGKDKGTAPLSASALSWLDVFVEGFGEDTCKPNDSACLERNRKL